MSDKVTQLVELVSKLPEEAQDAFLNQAIGAVTAFRVMEAQKEGDAGDGDAA